MISRLLLVRSFLNVQVTRTLISLMSFNFDQIRPLTAKLAALGRLKKYPTDLLLKSGVSVLAYSFVIESLSMLLVARTCIEE